MNTDQIKTFAGTCLLLIIVLCGGSASAACIGPAGVAGDTIYNTDFATLQFCNGTSWVGIGGGGGGVGTLTPNKWCAANAGGTAIDCTQNAPAGSAAGSSGQLQFNGVSNAFAADTALVWDNTNKRLGIGTPTPAYQLDNVKADGATSGVRDYISRNYLTLNPASASSAYKSAQLNTVYTSGAVNYTGDIMAGYNLALHNGSGTLAAAFGAYGQAYNATTGTITSAYGAFGIAENSLGGTITSAFGGQFLAQNDAAGTIANAYGSNSVAQNLGTKNITAAMYGVSGYSYIAGASGTTPTMIGGNFYSQVNNAGATATNAYGVSAGVYQAAGTITNAFGFYTGPIQGTNKWAFYQSGTENNYFGGNVGIGTTSPNVKLDVTGAIVSRVYNAGASTSIDWSQANVAYTSASCGAFTFTNMQDGGNYNLFIEGTTAGTCSFSHSGLTFKYPPGHGATTTSTMTVYSFTRAGSYVFVTWIPGF